MKKLMTIILIITLILPSLTGCNISSKNSSFNGGDSYDEDINDGVINGNTSFAFNIFKELNSEDMGNNIFISPISISSALTMAYQGARTKTKEAMAKTLGYNGIDIENINDGYKSLLRHLDNTDDNVDLDINNSIWIREGEKIDNSFIDTNKDVFNAKVSQLDFSRDSAANEINNWISNATKGKIQKMISPPIDKDVIMYLINAIYFKGSWSEGFDKKRTRSREFYSENGDKRWAMMMSENGEFEYGEGKDYKVLRLPYGDGKVSMYCILPNEETSISKLIKNMDINKWEDIKKSISKTDDVLVKIPRFKIEYGIKDLSKGLSQLGMTEAFKGSADFSGISDDVAISRVLHKAIIDVNEEGSEASAATVVEINKTAAVIDPITFIGNRPFMFVISHDETESILFMGKLSDIK